VTFVAAAEAAGTALPSPASALPSSASALAHAIAVRLARLVELCLGLVRVGGRLLAQKTENEATGTAERAIEIMGGSLTAVHASPSGSRRAGTVVVIEKIRPTPAAYPRRPGVPNRKLL